MHSPSGSIAKRPSLIGGIAELPSVTVHGSTAEPATLRAEARASRVIDEEIERGQLKPSTNTLQFPFLRKPVERYGKSGECAAADWVASSA